MFEMSNKFSFITIDAQDVYICINIILEILLLIKSLLSDRLHNLTDDDVNWLKDNNYKTIIDLRGKDEINNYALTQSNILI